MAKNDDDSRQEVGFDSNFDSRLMGAGDVSSSKSKVGALNEAKHQGENNGGEVQQEPSTLREAVIAEKRKQQQAEQEKEKTGGPKNMATALMRRGASEFLQKAWFSLFPSWGLTLIWINIHALLSLVIGKEVFCRLGDEWLDGKFGGPNPAKEAALGKDVSQLTDKIKGCANMGETMMVALLDLVAIVTTIAALSLIAMLLKVVSNPLDFLSALFGWVWDSAKAIISS